jgi:hypothetical protein
MTPLFDSLPSYPAGATERRVRRDTLEQSALFFLCNRDERWWLNRFITCACVLVFMPLAVVFVVTPILHLRKMAKRVEVIDGFRKLQLQDGPPIVLPKD